MELAYRELEEHSKTEVRHLKSKMEILKTQIEDRDYKASTQVDPQVLRVNIKKEITASFSTEINTKQHKIEKLEEELRESKRAYESLKITFDCFKEDRDRDIAHSNLKHKEDTSQLMLEVQALQHKLEDTSEKDLIRELKRDQIYKQKYQNALDQISEIRKERDEIKSRINDDILHARNIADEATSSKRELSSEIDRLKFKIKCLEEDTQKDTWLDEKSKEINDLKVDKSTLEGVIKEKERLIMTLNRQLSDAKDDIKNNEREFRTTLQKLTDDEKRRSRDAQLEIDTLKDKAKDVEQRAFETNVKNKRDIENLQLDNVKYEKEIKVFTEENRILKNKTADLDQEIDRHLKKSNEDENNIDRITREVKELRHDLRSTQSQLKSKINSEQELERTNKKMKYDFERQIKELKDKKGSIDPDEITRAYQKLKNNSTTEISLLKQKLKEYKDKVRIANEIIQNLGAKIAHLELENR